jgi:hypothetical protein
MTNDYDSSENIMLMHCIVECIDQAHLTNNKLKCKHIKLNGHHYYE